MTVYQGHWDQLPPNPKYPDQEPTAYIRASAGTNEEIRDRLDTWSTNIINIVNDQAEDIKEQDGTSIARAREIAWQEIDSALQAYSDGRPIGSDPQVYTTKYCIGVCKKELQARQKNGRLKDIKKSMVDRHNWQVVHWACARFSIETLSDIEPEHLDWIEDRVIDVQSTPVATTTRSQRMLNQVFA
jgi:hypothetical protein